MNPETNLQIACVKWFRLQHSSKVLFMITNDNAKTARQGALDKARGLLKGMPDVMIAEPTAQYAGLFIEFKAGKGKLSDAQAIMGLNLQASGYSVKAVRSIDEFIEVVNEYLNS